MAVWFEDTEDQLITIITEKHFMNGDLFSLTQPQNVQVTHLLVFKLHSVF